MASKGILALVVGGLMSLSLAGCGGSTSPPPNSPEAQSADKAEVDKRNQGQKK